MKRRPGRKKQTHVSLRSLAGDLVFKLKRAVLFPYLDFSTPQKREKVCRAEIALNSRAAPSLYLGVRGSRGSKANGLPSTERANWSIASSSCGVLPRPTCSTRWPANIALNRAISRRLAETLANFHANAARVSRRRGRRGHGAFARSQPPAFRGAPGSRRRRGRPPGPEIPRRTGALTRSCSTTRAENGFVRLCHGDLYLRNICLFQGRPTLFDCIEFDEALANIDVLYDVAFTLMDLWLIGRRELANLLFNRYASAFSRTLPDLPRQDARRLCGPAVLHGDARGDPLPYRQRPGPHGHGEGVRRTRPRRAAISSSRRICSSRTRRC